MVLPERQQVKIPRGVEYGSKKIHDQHDYSPGMDQRKSPVLWCDGGELFVVLVL